MTPTTKPAPTPNAAPPSATPPSAPNAHALRTSATFSTERAAPNPDATITLDLNEARARFTILTPALIRIEWQPDAHDFESRPSFFAINRNLPAPEFHAERHAPTNTHAAGITITTASLRLTYRPTLADTRFSESNLLIERIEPDVADPARWPFAWKPGTPATGNLGGTVRTLDGVSGATELPAGLLSKDGWSLVDDSDTPVFDNITAHDGHPRAWPTARWHMHAEHACTTCGTITNNAAPRHATVPTTANPSDHARQHPIDWYFFAHGRDYPAALADFARLSGNIPVPPRYALGVWWSRYWAYSDTELKNLVAEFNQHQVPLDVLVIDMDWHLDGWTGYTWNPEYFPEPEAFLDWCHQNNLRTTLNLHPADGVGKHERAFHEFARAMGQNTFHVYRVPFDCTDPKFIDLYFELLHHPIEAQGIDFWWMDWQQGTATTIPGLDPLPWLNHLHWGDMEHGPRSDEHRPLIFSRWGGLGNHRYQIGFSGDTYNDWESLAFQPRFTATAGNVGYAWWSHDIGGHQPGPVEPELYVRWIQFAITSPILRTHASKNPKAERRIWSFPQDHFNAARQAFLLRTRLIPYLYSAAHQTHDTTLPLCRPLYLEWPTLDAAYEHPDQYLLGDALLCAPVLEPAEPTTGIAETTAWLPPGQWTHWFTGRAYEGPGHIVCRSTLDQFPLFIRAGSAITLATDAAPVLRSSDITGEQLTLRIARPAPGESRTTTLIEDDTLSPAYLQGHRATTDITVTASADGRTTTIEIAPTHGTHDRQPTQRCWTIELLAAAETTAVRPNDRDLPQTETQSQAQAQFRVQPRSITIPETHEPSNANHPTGWSIDPSRGILHMRLSTSALRDLSRIQISHTADAQTERAAEDRPTTNRQSLSTSIEPKKPAAPNASPRRPRGL
ncbi:MAG: TIM-barrel domain-containing protein [Phycisphaerales bacterium]